MIFIFPINLIYQNQLFSTQILHLPSTILGCRRAAAQALRRVPIFGPTENTILQFSAGEGYSPSDSG